MFSQFAESAPFNRRSIIVVPYAHLIRPYVRSTAVAVRSGAVLRIRRGRVAETLAAPFPCEVSIALLAAFLLAFPSRVVPPLHLVKERPIAILILVAPEIRR